MEIQDGGSRGDYEDEYVNIETEVTDGGAEQKVVAKWKDGSRTYSRSSKICLAFTYSGYIDTVLVSDNSGYKTWKTTNEDYFYINDTLQGRDLAAKINYVSGVTVDVMISALSYYMGLGPIVSTVAGLLAGAGITFGTGVNEGDIFIQKTIVNATTYGFFLGHAGVTIQTIRIDKWGNTYEYATFNYGR